MHGDGLAALCSLDSSLGSLHDAIALQGGYLNYLAAQVASQLVDIYLVPVLADDIHHVYRDNDRDAQLGELSCKVKVTFQVRAVDDV